MENTPASLRPAKLNSTVDFQTGFGVGDPAIGDTGKLSLSDASEVGASELQPIA